MESHFFVVNVSTFLFFIIGPLRRTRLFALGGQERHGPRRRCLFPPRQSQYKYNLYHTDEHDVVYLIGHCIPARS